MSWVATAVVSAAAIGSAAYSGSQANKAAKKNRSLLDGLQYQEDPNFTETQTKLKDYGTGLLDGNIPDYYKAIGQSNSQEFQDLLSMNTKDVQTAANEAAAKSGRARGGYLPAATSGALADSAAQLRYSDYARSLQGKEYLLNTGNNMLSGVRSAAFGNQQQENAFDQNKVNAYMGLNNQVAQNNSQMWSSIAGSVSGAVSGGGGSSLLSLLSRNNTGAGTQQYQPSALSLSGRSPLGSIMDNTYTLGNFGNTRYY
jgi:hypothetical protein